MQAQGPAQAGAAEGILGQALGRLFAVSEAYPQLRATENFQQLQSELTNTEDQIAAARRIYNGNVQSYNTKIQTFPGSLIAGMGGFTAREYFEITDAADREPVQVSFSDPTPARRPLPRLPRRPSLRPRRRPSRHRHPHRLRRGRSGATCSGRTGELGRPCRTSSSWAPAALAGSSPST